MARACTVCEHDDLEAIDREITGGVPRRVIAARRPDLTDSAIGRHTRSHVSAALVRVDRAEVVEVIGRGGTLLERVEALTARVERVLDEADLSGKPSQVLAASKEVRALLELLGKISGELRSDPSVQVFNLNTDPALVRMQAEILSALLPFPGAAVAVARALSEFSGDES
ncbi:MAG: hypothetical protein V9G12_05210 [Microthrixaceae bacterium]